MKSELTMSVLGACVFGAAASGGIVAEPGEMVVADGIVYSSLGQASLSESGGVVTVSGIGSSGSDGVSVELGGVNGWSGKAGLEISDPSLVPEGAFIQSDSYDDADNLLGSYRFDFLGDRLRLSIDLAPTPTGEYTIRMYRSGSLVHEETGRTTSAAVDFPIAAVAGRHNLGCWAHPDPFENTLRTSWGIQCPFAVAMSIVDGPTVMADNVVIELDGGVMAGLDRIDWTAADTGSFSIENSDMVQFQQLLHNQGLGAAVLQGHDGGVMVSELGPLGDDGLRIDLTPEPVPGETHYAARVQAQWSQAPAAPGELVAEALTLLPDEETLSAMGRSSVAYDGSGATIGGDFSEISTSAVRY